MTATVDLRPTFFRIGGWDALTIDAQASTMTQSHGLELALVVDGTGSMRGKVGGGARSKSRRSCHQNRYRPTTERTREAPIASDLASPSAPFQAARNVVGVLEALGVSSTNHADQSDRANPTVHLCVETVGTKGDVVKIVRARDKGMAF